jgi:hypothetical protein
MDFPYAEEDVAALLARVFRGDVRSDETTHYFRHAAVPDRDFSLSRARLTALLESVRGLEVNEETALHSDISYEIIVNEESQFPTRRLRDEALRVNDPESNISYEVSQASDIYLIWLICTASARGPLRDLGFGVPVTRMRLDRLITEASAAEIDALDVLRAISFRFVTLKLTSLAKQSLKRFQIATYSFLFHVAYNLDLAFVPQRFVEEVSRRGRISRMRRSTAEELDPPRRSYNEDLVNHYVLAISTDSPTVQFLSYYHVLEHFFESVFNEDLIEQIKTSITQPGFSYKRKKDVGQLITTIKKALQIRSETITFSELDALRLSLTKFISVPQLLAKIDEYDPTLAEYYATFEVPFSKGSTVALRSGESERVVRELTKRIYSTRNALVHSKDGDKARYIPFKDERALVMEIPLMRFVSEMVILAVSELA